MPRLDTYTSQANTFVIVGSGGGLGSAIVNALGCLEHANVIAISRMIDNTVKKQTFVTNNKQRIKYEKIDIRENESLDLLRRVANSVPQGPVTVIYNSAIIDEDVKETIDFNSEVAKEIVDVNVLGLLRTLDAFQSVLKNNGGTFLGISSASALVYPFAGPLATYPASKAFMNKMLQGISICWPQNVRTLTIHLGSFGSVPETTLRRLYNPSYRLTAQYIVQILNTPSKSRSYTYPLLHAIAYRILHHLFVLSWPVKLARLCRRLTTRT